jgi:hypothetical protein
MPKSLDATFEPGSQWKPIEEGTYPAHIASLSTKEVNTRAGEAIVVNMTYKVADEVDEMTQLLWEMDGYNYLKDQSGDKIPLMNGDGEQQISDCSHMKNKTFYDNGFFIFTDTSSSSKNRRYFELLDNLGINCEENTVGGKKVKQLVLIEEEDVVGKPVFVTIKRHEFVTSETKNLPYDQQEKRSTFKVNNVKTWSDGYQISMEEMDDDVPF